MCALEVKVFNITEAVIHSILPAGVILTHGPSHRSVFQNEQSKSLMDTSKGVQLNQSHL